MILGLFKPKGHPHKRETDTVWMTDEERNRGVIADAELRLKQGERVAIGACGTEITRALEQARGLVPVEIIKSEDLAPDRLNAEAHNRTNLTLLLVGLFSDPDYEEKLLTECKDLSCKILLIVHYSFSELVTAGLVSPGLEQTLKNLGVRTGEAISSSATYRGRGRMVSGAIAKARRKNALSS